MVPAALEEEDERLKMNAGRWMYIQRLTCQNHLLTKLTTTCVSLDLLAHISASKNVARIQPIFSEFSLFLRGRIYSQFDLFFELQSISWAR